MLCVSLMQLAASTLLILIMSIPRLLSLFRKKSDEEKRFFEIERWQRVVMTLLYFGLIAALLFGMSLSQVEPNADAPPRAPSKMHVDAAPAVRSIRS